MKADRVANHSLQSPTHWVGYTPIDSMDGAHLQNSLRLLIRHPLGQLAQSWERHVWEAVGVPDDVGIDEDLPDGGQDIYEELERRRKWDEARTVAEIDDIADLKNIRHPTWFTTRSEAVDHLAENGEPDSIERLNERAAEWIVRQPTFLAMRERLVDLIIAGEAHVMRDHRPSLPGITYDQSQEPF